MASGPKIFLLPCACAAEIEIVVGQAGGSLSCPACGRRVDVPKLRDFAGLRVKSVAAAPPGRRWGLPHAVALAGVAVAAIAWGAAAVVGAVPKAAFSPEQIRADVRAEDDLVLYQGLQDLATASVARMPMREEFQLQRRAYFAAGMSRTLTMLGGVAAVVAAAAGLALLVASQPS